MVQLGWSHDNGQSFGAPIKIDTLSPQGPIGRVDVVMPEKNTAIVSWLGRNSKDQATLYLRLVKANGELGNYLQIAELNAGRATGFPQTALFENSLILAWTENLELENGASIKNLRLVKLNISEITSLPTSK